jgi:hypothetical protein
MTAAPSARAELCAAVRPASVAGPEDGDAPPLSLSEPSLPLLPRLPPVELRLLSAWDTLLPKSEPLDAPDDVEPPVLPLDEPLPPELPAPLDWPPALLLPALPLGLPISMPSNNQAGCP